MAKIVSIVEAFDFQKEEGHQWRVEFFDEEEGWSAHGDSYKAKDKAVLEAKREANDDFGWVEGTYILEVEGE